MLKFSLKNLLLITILIQLESYSYTQNLSLVKEIFGTISPKSIVHNGYGLFSAQNMMYRHTVTLYNAKGDLLTTIEDKADLKSFGFDTYKSDSYYGAPVEACFSQNGKYLWVSNYSMLGKEFKNEGCDACSGSNFDPSFVYKINTLTNQIENVIKVGSVPKYLAINEKSNLMLVTNWTGADVSIIDLVTEKEIKKINIGRHPRGVAIVKDGSKAYITVMGGYDIVELDLITYKKEIISKVGKAPRHVVLSKNDEFLYCTINSENKILKLNLSTGKREYCKVKSVPRTMVLSKNQKYLYVVNYFTDSFQKVEVETMTVVETKKTGHHPIGISANWETSEIWVACYSGVIQIFKDNLLAVEVEDEKLLANNGIQNIPQYSFQNMVAYNKVKLQKQKIELKEKGEEELLAIANQKEIDKQQAIIKVNQLKKEKELKQIEEHKLEIEKNQRIKELERIENQKIKSENDRIEKQKEIELKAKRKKELETQKNIVFANSKNCKYHIIIGSFGLKSNAVALEAKMKSKGYPAQSLISKNGKMTMVSIQCFSSMASLSKVKSKILRESKQKGWVYTTK